MPHLAHVVELSEGVELGAFWSDDVPATLCAVMRHSKVGGFVPGKGQKIKRCMSFTENYRCKISVKVALSSKIMLD